MDMDLEKAFPIKDRPADILCPGQMVREIMEKTFVGEGQAARRLGLTPEELQSFYQGEYKMTKDLAFKLKAATGFTAAYWQGFERQFRRRIDKWREKASRAAS